MPTSRTAYHQQWRQNNPEKVKAYNAKRRVAKMLWQRENKERLRDQNNATSRASKARKRATDPAWVEKIREQDRQHYEANRETRQARQRLYHWKNKAARNLMARLNRVGITESQYQAAFVEQGGVCAVCKQLPLIQTRRDGKRLQTLFVDHDHLTGKFRGLLCHGCNAGIGMLGDSADILLMAASYVARSRE